MAGTSGISSARPPSGDEHRAPRQAGRYVLGELLGRGGMAEVFAGRSMGSHGFQKPVAIKRLLPELANDRSFVDRLIEEAKLLVGMQHGNVVSVLDLAREADDVFLVMEYVDGPSLRQLLKARGERGVSLGIATYVVQAAAAGLEFAHARSIIHADVSPSNLLLTTSGEVRVADFGIARKEGVGQGIVEGKWAYMAPEQARGQLLTPAADVFALGVVLYELLTGQHPFGRKITATDRESSPLRVVPPRVVRPSVPHGLDAICMTALAHDPRERYQRAQHMIDALVDERFANHYRDGAAELAIAIREVEAFQGLKSMPDRPSSATIVTSSLLLDKTPGASGRIAASLGFAAVSEFAEGSVPHATAFTPPPSLDELGAAITGEPVKKPALKTWHLAIVVAVIAVAVGVIAAIAIQMEPEPIKPVDTTTKQSKRHLAPKVEHSEPPTATATATATSAPAPVVPAKAEAPAKIDLPRPSKLAPPKLQNNPPATVKNGTLHVTSEPWADVTIDGEQHGETPSTRFTVKPGKHTVRLKNGETGAVVTRTITVAEGATALVRVGADQW